MKILFLCFLGLLGSYGLFLSNAQDMTIESQFHPFIDVGNEFIIDTSIVYVPAPRSQYRPSVAFDGTNYFVVWREYYYGVSDVIYGARIDRSCDVLDPLGIAISSGGEDKWWPCIAYGNTSYLVVWTYDRGGDAKICGARVSQSGVVLDTLSIDISPPQHLAWHPSVAFDGTNYFVVWSNATFGNYYTDIFGARVNQDGTLLDTSGIPISTAINTQSHPSIAFDGTNYFVVWQDYHYNDTADIYGVRISPSGEVLDPSAIPIFTGMADQVYPSVAFGDTNYLVVWQGPYWVNNDIYGARVTLTGTVLDPGGIPISTGEGGQHHPSVSFDGNHYLVVWMDGRDVSFDIYGTRVSQSGEVLEPFGLDISTEENDQWYPSLTFGDTTYLVVWEDKRGMTSDIYGTRVVQSGEVLDTSGIIISTAGHSEQYPSIGFNNTNYLVVWEDSRNTDYYDIYGARVNQSGTILDPSGIGISICNESQHSPEVESNGFSHLVVWEDTRSDTSEIYGTLVIPSGLVLDTHGVELSIEGHGQSPSIAYDGINYLTVWSDEHFIRGTRVDILCRVIDSSGINIAIGDTIRSSPSVAFGNNNYLVVWEATLFSVPSDSKFYTLIYGARVAPNGTVLDTQEILISMNGCSPHCPSVAFDGTNYFVFWSDYDINTEQNIYGTRIDETGTVLDTLGIPISTAMGTQISPSAIFDGTNYIVIWRDRRSNNWDLYGARVTTAGEVIDTFTASAASYDESTANIAYGAGEQSLIVYSHYMGSPYKNERVFGRFYTSTGAEEEEELGLLQNIPNPFRSVTIIHYFVSGKSLKLISLNIYNLAGQLIRSLVNESQSPGEYIVNWDGRDETGKRVATGIYFARLNTGSISKNIKITIVR